MKTYGMWWWIAARHWSEVVAYSPLVIGERMLASALEGARPSAAHQAEMTRMVVEKGEAVAESTTALWLAAAEAQQQAWQRAWRAGRPAPMPADFALSATTARKLGNAVGPISRRVSANAKRLRRKRRKTS